MVTSFPELIDSSSRSWIPLLPRGASCKTVDGSTLLSPGHLPPTAYPESQLFLQIQFQNDQMSSDQDQIFGITKLSQPPYLTHVSHGPQQDKLWAVQGHSCRCLNQVYLKYIQSNELAESVFQPFIEEDMQGSHLGKKRGKIFAKE